MMMGLTCAASASVHRSFVAAELVGHQLHPDNKPLFTCCAAHCNVFTSGSINISGSGGAKLLYKGQKRRIGALNAKAYKKIPMGTPGAYQLLDEETGEKVIVWGGDEDKGGEDGANGHFSSSSLPSEHALSWKPKTQQLESEMGRGDASKATASRRGLARLNSPKLNALIRKKSSKPVGGTTSRGKPEIPESFIDQNIDDGGGGEDDAGEQYLDNEDISLPSNVNKRHHRHVKEAAQGCDHMPGGTPKLASNMRGWSRAASERNNYVIAQPRHNRKKLVDDSGFFSRKSFKDMGCTDDIIESLRSLSFLRPSHIQAMAYGPVFQGKSCIIADQSGSGKTLAYLLPVIQRLRQEELQGLGKSSARSPRVVILVPTAELASQVLVNCRAISKHGVPFRSMVVTGGFRQKTQLDNLKQEVDVLIATPGRFIFLLQEGFVKLSNLKCVVLDEVDILYGDEGFEEVLQRLINSVPLEAQYLFVTATLPVDVYNKLVQVFPDCEVTMGPGVHRTSSRLEEILVDCSGDGEEKNPETAFLNKKSALLQLAEESPVSRTIVFCNKIETCRKVENILNRFDRKGLHIKVLPFHAALDQNVRLTNMKEFLNMKSKDFMFLICTDRASRGIDFPDVDHVVLFDFPRDPSEYVRRVGRTARGARSEGKAFIFVVGKQVSLARRIIERNKKGHPLHDVPSAYELER